MPAKLRSRRSKRPNKKGRKTRSKRERAGNPTATNIPSPPPIEYMIDAIEEGEEKQVKLLLEMGANVNAKDPRSGNTPLIEASASKLPTIVKMLLAVGADVNVKNNKGNTALMEAINCDWIDPDWKPWYQVEYDITEIMEMLLAAGAVVNVKNDGGKTALDIAEETGCTKKIQTPLKRHNVEQFIPRHLQTQRERKKDRRKLHMVMSAKRIHPDLERFTAYYLGGKRKSKKPKKRTTSAKGTRRQKRKHSTRNTKRKNTRARGASLSRSRHPKEVTKEETPSVRPQRRVSFYEMDILPDTMDNTDETQEPQSHSRDNISLPPSSSEIIDMSIARQKMRRKFNNRIKKAVREGDINPDDPEDKAHIARANVALENMFKNSFPDLYRR